MGGSNDGKEEKEVEKSEPVYNNITVNQTPRSDLINNIPSFSKHQENFTIKDFCRTIDLYCGIGNWSGEMTARIAKAKIVGKAGKIIRMDTEINDEWQWTELKRKLIKKFEPLFLRPQLVMKLAVCRQRPTETVEEFAIRIGDLIEPLQPVAEDDTVQEALNNQFEEEKLGYFKNGLLPQLKTFVQLVDPETFEEAVERAKQHEADTGVIAESICTLQSQQSNIDRSYEEKVEQWIRDNEQKSQAKLERIEKAVENLSVCVVQAGRKNEKKVEAEELAIALPGRSQEEYDGMPQQIRMFGKYLAQTIVEGLRESNVRINQNNQNSGRQQRQLRRCFNCQKLGTHIARDCRGQKKPRFDQNPQQQEENALVRQAKN